MENLDFKCFHSELFSKAIQLKISMEKILTPIAQKYELTPLGIFILVWIKSENNSTIGSICKNTNLNQGNVSSMCKKLEKHGFILRSRKKEDERVVLLKLTDKGIDVIEKINKELYKIELDLDEISIEKINNAVKGFKEFADVIIQIAENISKKSY